MGESAPLPGETKLWRRFLKSSEGSAAVEFALILNILFLMILGMLEFGLAFSYRQVIINASREGARYGAVYRVDNLENPVLPTQRTPSISDWVLLDLPPPQRRPGAEKHFAGGLQPHSQGGTSTHGSPPRQQFAGHRYLRISFFDHEQAPASIGGQNDPARNHRHAGRMR